MSKYIYILLWLVLGWFSTVTICNLILHNKLDWQALLTVAVCGGLLLLNKNFNNK